MKSVLLMLEQTSSLDDCIEELTRAMECARRNIEQMREKEDDDINLSAWTTDDEENQPDQSEVPIVPTRTSNLTILESMGFHDTKLNEKLLKRMKGNLDAVVEKLLDIVSRDIDESKLLSITERGPSTSKPSNSSAGWKMKMIRTRISFLIFVAIALKKIYGGRYRDRSGFSQIDVIFTRTEIRSRSGVDDL